MGLLRDGVGVEVCLLVMVKVMEAFVHIVVDQDEQVLHRPSAFVPNVQMLRSCGKRAALEYNIEHIQCC